MLFIFSSPILNGPKYVSRCSLYYNNNKCYIKQNKINILYIWYILVTIH